MTLGEMGKRKSDGDVEKGHSIHPGVDLLTKLEDSCISIAWGSGSQPS